MTKTGLRKSPAQPNETVSTLTAAILLQQTRHDARIMRRRIFLPARGEPLAQSGLRASGIKTHETAPGKKLRGGGFSGIKNDRRRWQELPPGLIERLIDQRPAEPAPLMFMRDAEGQDQHRPVRFARGEIAHGTIICSDGEPE